MTMAQDKSWAIAPYMRWSALEREHDRSLHRGLPCLWAFHEPTVRAPHCKNRDSRVPAGFDPAVRRLWLSDSVVLGPLDRNVAVLVGDLRIDRLGEILPVVRHVSVGAGQVDRRDATWERGEREVRHRSHLTGEQRSLVSAQTVARFLLDPFDVVEIGRGLAPSDGGEVGGVADVLVFWQVHRSSEPVGVLVESVGHCSRKPDQTHCSSCHHGSPRKRRSERRVDQDRFCRQLCWLMTEDRIRRVDHEATERGADRQHHLVLRVTAELLKLVADLCDELMVVDLVDRVVSVDKVSAEPGGVTGFHDGRDEWLIALFGVHQNAGHEDDENLGRVTTDKDRRLAEHDLGCGSGQHRKSPLSLVVGALET